MNSSTLTRPAPIERPPSSTTASSTPGSDSPDSPGSGSAHPSSQGPSRARRVWRGNPDDPVWTRPALLGLLAATALLYLWGLGASGWANSFYSAAVQAGSESWKAFFFGSSDAANSITVDKTPLSLWPMALSVRIFGLSSWSILVPQALEGVASVGLLYATVRRTTRSPGAGLLAGAVLALTPVAVLMFRFNNPDAMLVLLMIGAAYATLRALHSPRALRWVALGGALVGLAFLTKMLQAFLVLPALALVYLIAASVPFTKRVGHLLAAFGSMILAGGWWVAIVSLWPAASRPYIGGSQHNSILELTLGYNGLGRLSGNETGSVGGGGNAGGGTGGGMWGSTGITRLFGSEVGGQIAWLLPAALILAIASLIALRRAPRTDAIRAGVILWVTWLLVTGLTFSFMAGIFHAYYTVALAPAIAALVGIGSWLLWTRRDSLAAVVTLGFAVSLTAAFAFALLGRTTDFVPWLRWVVLIVGLLAGAGLVLTKALPGRVSAAIAAVAVIVSLAGPAAYAVDTASTPHTGSIPSAGPTSGQGPGGMGGPGGTGGRMGGGGTPPTGTQGGTGTQAGTGQQQGTRGGAGGMGGLLNGSTSSAALTKLLTTDASDYTWAAAAIGSNTAAGYQLASQQPVMAIGGFNGSDPSPTLAQFKKLVAAGEIHYFIGGGGFGGQQNGGSSSSSDIASWVADTFTATTVDGVTVYDLSAS